MKYSLGLVLLIALTLSIGCSVGSGTPVDVNKTSDTTITKAHYNWGLWQFIADPVNGTLDVARLREGNMHLNKPKSANPASQVFLFNRCQHVGATRWVATTTHIPHFPLIVKFFTLQSI